MHIQQQIQTVFDLIEQSQKMIALCLDLAVPEGAGRLEQITNMASDLATANNACLAALTGQPVAMPAVVDETPAPDTLTSPAFDPTPQKRTRRSRAEIDAANAAKIKPARRVKAAEPVQVELPMPVQAQPVQVQPEPVAAASVVAKQVRRRTKPLEIVTFANEVSSPVKPSKPARRVKAAAQPAPVVEAPPVPVRAAKVRKAAAAAPVIPAVMIPAPKTRKRRNAQA